MGFRTRGLVTASLVLLLALVVAPSEAPADSAASLRAKQTSTGFSDPPGDVRVSSRPGPSPELRRSIDLLRVRTVTEGRAARFTIRIKEIDPSARLDQMVFIVFRPRPAAGDTWNASLGLSVQAPSRAYAYYTPNAGGMQFVNCGNLSQRNRPVANLVSIVVPRRCLPSDPAVTTGRTVLGTFESNSPTFAVDRFRAARLIDLY